MVGETAAHKSGKHHLGLGGSGRRVDVMWIRAAREGAGLSGLVAAHVPLGPAGRWGEPLESPATLRNGAAWGHHRHWRFWLHCDAPGASCAAQAMAQALCWGARAPRPLQHKQPPCSRPLFPPSLQAGPELMSWICGA